MYYVNLIWISVSCLSFVFNMIVLFLAIERHHERLEAKILAVDPDYQSILDTYHPIIIDMKSATIPMNILLLEATVSENRNAVVQVPQSLFTRERQAQSNPQAVQQN
ncbi:hypothetical protein L3Y34_007996 [Caenorhabditis briggsae]|uniref:Uncharacterized protein n=1 Tax=Caenorhabditis briggsae TaxID=6238 RepID=A0AAE9D0H5_CAEBR|nr:hypothetical protein L3Y34_007996 [Caenorhabditis briggsae]